MTHRKPGIWVVEISRDGEPWAYWATAREHEKPWTRTVARRWAELHASHTLWRYRAARYERVSE